MPPPVDIEEVCGIVTASMTAGDYDYCVTTLKLEWKSKSTDDLHDLATLAMMLAISHDMSTVWEIVDLMDLESDLEIKESYNSCLDTYNDAIGQLWDALDSLISKLYFEEMSLLKRCEEAFKDAKASPLMIEDKDYQRLENISYLITTSIE